MFALKHIVLPLQDGPKFTEILAEFKYCSETQLVKSGAHWTS